MCIKITKNSIFLIFYAKKFFNYLKQTFIKVSILSQFDFKSYIQIKTNVLDYIIGKLLSQLNTNWIVSDKSNLVKFDFSQ